jgi:hypothetical protein
MIKTDLEKIKVGGKAKSARDGLGRLHFRLIQELTDYGSRGSGCPRADLAAFSCARAADKRSSARLEAAKRPPKNSPKKTPPNRPTTTPIQNMVHLVDYLTRALPCIMFLPIFMPS